MQHGLAEWQTFLIDKPFPVLMRTKLDVQDLIDQSQLSITQYAAPILFDAGFSACIFKHVNTQREKAGRNPLTTLENALSHLGQTAFQDFLNRTVIFEELKLPDRNVQGYMRVMGQSCHAALQSKNWAQQSNTAQYDEIYLAALLQNITELMLWCYGGNVMPEIEKICYADKKTYESAARQVLGCGMRELGAVLARKWNFPEMASEGLASTLDNFTLATGVALASELARVVDINWYGNDAIDIISRIAKYMGKAEGDVAHSLHLMAVNVTDILLDKNYLAPARLLPQMADDKYIDQRFVLHENSLDIEKLKVDEKPGFNKTNAVNLQAIKARAEVIKKSQITRTSVAKMPVAEKLKIRPSVVVNSAVSERVQKQMVVENNNKKPVVTQELTRSIQAFKQLVLQGKPVHELIDHVVQTMLYCGVERCVFVAKLPNSSVLVSRYAAQIADDLAIRQLKIPVNTPHVFSLLMEKSRNVFINDSNRQKYWNLIPEPVKLTIGVKQFFAMSIFANNHAMGLMYADKVQGGLTAGEYVQFQAICRLLCNGIVESIKHKKT